MYALQDAVGMGDFAQGATTWQTGQNMCVVFSSGQFSAL